MARQADSRNGIAGSRNTQSATRERLAYTVSIMEFHNDKVVQETQYFGDPFEVRAWLRQWVQRIA
jgi:hypothetical protein